MGARFERCRDLGAAAEGAEGAAGQVEPHVATHRSAVAVDVCAALSGSFICRVEAHSLSDLKESVEKACGVYRCDQWLTCGREVLKDGVGLEFIASSDTMTVAMLQRRSLAGVAWRALSRLIEGDGDVRSAVASLNVELEELPAQRVNELEAAATVIIEKALSAPEWSENCAEIAHALHVRNQRAPPGHWGAKTDAFRTALRGLCQAEYQHLLAAFYGFEPSYIKYTEARLLSMMTFCARLFECELLPVGHLRVMVNTLVGEDLPEEHLVRCACELLSEAGPAMAEHHEGRSLLANIARRLADLKNAADPAFGAPKYSKGLVARMMSVMELGSDTMAIALLKRRSLAGVAWRALKRLIESDGDVRSAVASLNVELEEELPAQSVNELEAAATAIIEKALSAPQWSENCAEIAHALHVCNQRAPPGHWGEKPDAFRTALRGLCQAEYQHLLAAFNGFEPSDIKYTEARLLSMMTFCARLFECELMPVGHLRIMVHTLIGEELPEEHLVRCACELLSEAGPAMAEHHEGPPLLTRIVRRLADLKNATDPASRAPQYSKGLVARMKSLMDLEGSEWGTP